MGYYPLFHFPSHCSTFRRDGFIIHTTSHQQKTTFHSFYVGTVGNFMEEVGLYLKEVEQSKLFALKNTARFQMCKARLKLSASG